jgi:hypothetical protein
MTVQDFTKDMTFKVWGAHLGACHDKRGMLLKEQLGNFSVVVHGCSMNGFLPAIIRGINVCSELQQQSTHLQLTCSRRKLKWRLFFQGQYIDGRIVILNQEPVSHIGVQIISSVIYLFTEVL